MRNVEKFKRLQNRKHMLEKRLKKFHILLFALLQMHERKIMEFQRPAFERFEIFK